MIYCWVILWKCVTFSFWDVNNYKIPKLLIICNYSLDIFGFSTAAQANKAPEGIWGKNIFLCFIDWFKILKWTINCNPIKLLVLYEKM